jgi:aspartate/methionine/tyrosine aminotransferase
VSSTLSWRAETLLNRPSVILKAAVQCYSDPYSAENTSGYLNFGVAENMLIDDLLLEKTSKSYFENPRYHHYHETFGCEEIRTAFTEFLHHNFYQRNYNPDNVVVSSGASAILEILSFCMFNPGDKILLPAPYYSGFETDLEVRFQAEILPFPVDVADNFYLDPTELIEFIKTEKPKAVLICHPHNPTGVAYSREYIQQLSTFCEENETHLIFDEVYFMTRLNQVKPATSLEFSEGSQYTHFVYSMAKDFALGGFKIGYFYSENQELLNAFKGVAYFHTPSTHTQLLCANMLRDQSFINNLIHENIKRIGQCFERIEEGILKDLCDHYTKPTNCFFNFINLSSLMLKLGIQGELEMFNHLLNKMKINMLPGAYFGYPGRNYFRLCYARTDEQIDEFIKRFKEIDK